MRSKNSGLVVVYLAPLALSLATWLFGWVILWNLLPNREVFPKNSPGPWFDVLFWSFILLVNGLLGPLLTLKYSQSIHVQDGQLSVRRYFGTIKKSYRMTDIVTVDIASPDNKVAKVKVVFRNGDTLTINGYASGFQDLCSLLAA